MELKERLKQLLIEGLNLEDITTDDIKDDMLLFGEGLGLDSLDAVELVVILEKVFGIEVKNLDEARVAFQSINALTGYVEQRRTK